MCGRYFPTFSPSIFSPKGPGAFGCRQFLGDPSEEDPPVPIPNTAVKLLSPDGTARASVWERRTSPGLIQSLPVKREAFSVYATRHAAKAAHELEVLLVQRAFPDFGQVLLELLRSEERR